MMLESLVLKIYQTNKIMESSHLKKLGPEPFQKNLIFLKKR